MPTLSELLTDSDLRIFDTEANALLDKVSRFHCLLTKAPGKPVVRYRNVGTEDTLGAGLKELRSAKWIVGHNIISYDIPAIHKVLGDDLKGPYWLDTLVLSRLAYPTLGDLDWRRRVPGMPQELYGRHSLKAWGYRLGILKGTFGADDDTAWESWSQEMEDYCHQDVLVTEKLLEHFAQLELPWVAIDMEMRLQDIIAAQERRGFQFDIPAAQKLNAKLQARSDELLLKLRDQFPSKPPVCLGPYGNQAKRMDRLLSEQGRTPADWPENRAWLEEAGIKFKWQPGVDFNPSSQKQVIERLTEMGWVPQEFTDNGQPKVDESILIALGNRFPEAQPLVEYQLLQKRIGQISDGDQSWLKKVGDDGRMHGRCNTMGAITYRFTHSNPNMAQVPKVTKPYGKECRGFFGTPEGRSLVGCDVAGLELRCLAHYLSRWDDGAYVKQVTTGDIHTHNMQAAGLTDRDRAKTLIYAFIYGAGDQKLGTIVLPDCDNSKELVKAGKKLRKRFLDSTPGLRRLVEGVRVKASRDKKLMAVDGRVLKIRSVHSALNTLLQSAGAIATKTATVIFRELLESRGYVMERDWCLVAHVHDEWQTECLTEIAPYVAECAVQSIVLAGERLGMRCPLTGAAKIGKTWADTH